MITTNTAKARKESEPQKLTILTTGKVKLRTEEQAVEAARVAQKALANVVNVKVTRKYSGPLLTTSGIEDARVNEKRRALMAKRKAVTAATPAVKPPPRKSANKRSGT